MERRGGEIWLTTHNNSAPDRKNYPPLAVKIAETDFVAAP